MLDARHPLTKFALAVAAIIVVSFSERGVHLASTAAVTLALLATGQAFSWARLARKLVPFVVFALASSWIYIVAENPAHTALGVSGWHSALIVSGRILVIGLISISFSETTKPADFARALVLQAHLPRRFVYGALAAVQFMPALAEEYRMAILTARASAPSHPQAGYRPRWWRDIAEGRPWDALLIVAAGAIRRAGNAAISMQMRGLSDRRLTNSWHRQPFTWKDRAVLATAALFFSVLFGLV